MVQRQRPLVCAVVVIHGGFQLFQDLGEVIASCFHRHRFPAVEGVGQQVFLLDDIREGVEIPFLFKGFFDQALRVGVRGQHIGLDELLAAVEVLHHGTRGHLQRQGIDR